MNKDLIRQSMWLDKKTLNALKEIAKREDRPIGWLVRKAAEEFVERKQVTK